MSYICKYCGRECKNDNSLRNHERLCKSNPNHQNVSDWSSGFKDYNLKLKNGVVQRKPSNQYIKAEEEGREKPVLSQATLNKLSIAAKGRVYTEEYKQRISEFMQRAVEEHPESYSARLVGSRHHKSEYHGFRMDSKWEVDVAMYLDSMNIQWIKPSNFFNYIWDGKPHKYFPDFYLPKYDRYIEVKGYERERDAVKYATIPDIILIKQKQITAIHQGQYNIFDELALSSAGRSGSLIN